LRRHASIGRKLISGISFLSLRSHNLVFVARADRLAVDAF